MPTQCKKRFNDGKPSKKSKIKKKNVDKEIDDEGEIVSCIGVMSKNKKFVENDNSHIKYALVGAYYDPTEIEEEELKKELELTGDNADYNLSQAVFNNEENAEMQNDEYTEKKMKKKKKKHPYYYKEEDSEDELHITEEDSLILNGKIYNEYGTLEIHVFNYDDNVFNIYDDIIIDGPPICLEIVEQNCFLSKYLVAIGTLNSSIGLWDLKASTDTLEPIAYLGNQQITDTIAIEKRKKRKQKGVYTKIEKKKKINGHTKCVCCLSYSNLKKNLLCSGSKDKTIKIWDLNNLLPVCTYIEHTKRVNDVKFHLTDNNLLVSTSLDKTLKLHDMRINKASLHIPLAHKPESCTWDTFNENVIFLSDTKGYISQMDIRKASSHNYNKIKKNNEENRNSNSNESTVVSFKAFDNPCVSVLTTHYKNLVLAASQKGCVVAYNFGKVMNDIPSILIEKQMKKNLYHMATNEECPNIIFLGSNELFDWDLKSCSEICNNFNI